MSKQVTYKIKENKQIASKVYKMVLEGDTSAITNSGQFINILVEGFFLRRPISVCDYDQESITILYKVFGKGTEKMSQLTTANKLDCLVGLGNGFDYSLAKSNPVLIGGGVGVPPMYNLAKELITDGKTPHVVLGFNSKEDVFYEEEFKQLGCQVHITTVDGSYGIKGFVTDALKDLTFNYYFTCGPHPMLMALANLEVEGQLSFEERMGCGFGACMGCSCKTVTGYKRICKEGPVLLSSEVIKGE